MKAIAKSNESRMWVSNFYTIQYSTVLVLHMFDVLCAGALVQPSLIGRELNKECPWVLHSLTTLEYSSSCHLLQRIF